MNAKRRTKERQAGEKLRSESSTDEELLEQLDHELSRLPDKYRVPVVLCELEGKGRKEVARQLAIPEGTLSWRLAQAKKLLAKRLSRHELAIPLGALAVGLSPTLRASTLRGALAAGTVPAQVLALTEGVIKAMLLNKLKVTMCAAVLMLLAGVGASGLTYRATAEEPKQVEYRKVYDNREDSRPATDDLDGLRLEIESLRKELRATKERVKALEEANAKIRRNDTRSRASESPQQPKTPQSPYINLQIPLTPYKDVQVPLTPYKDVQVPLTPYKDVQIPLTPYKAPQLSPYKDLQRPKDMPNTDKSLAGVEETLSKSVADLEEAVRKLLANPENKEAYKAFERAVNQHVIEAMEQALKRLKEEGKQREASPKKKP